MKILVVDDDTDARAATKLAIENEGYVVMTAADGIDALEQMDHLSPDLIISDILMPRMDGFSFCRHCKADSRFRDIPIILLTATYLDARDEELARRLGVELFLIKPQKPQSILEAVRSTLDRQRTQAQSPGTGAGFTDQEFNALHAEALCRKLEDKVTELEHAKQALERDIAARKQTSALFKGLFENSPIGIELYNREGNLIDANRACLALFGIADIGVVKKFNLFDDPNLDEQAKRDLRDGRTVAKEILFDFDLVTKHGLYPTVRTGKAVLDVHLSPLRTGVESIEAAYVVHVRDITERKKAEEALKESENILRTLINANPEAVTLLDAAGTVLACNEAVGFRLGKAAAEIVGTCLWDLFPGDLAVERKKHVGELFRTGKAMQFTDRRDDRIIENHCHPVINAAGVVTACAVTSIDITERVRAEQALQRQAQILDQIQESVITTDLEGIVTGWNKGAERLYWYSAAEVLGRHISFIYPEDQHTVLQQEVIAPLLEKGEHESEVRLRRKSGEEFYAIVLLTLLRDEQGEVIGMIGSSRDISRRRQAEEALHASEKKLRDITDHLGEGIYVFDAVGKITFMNPEAERLLGWTLEEMNNAGAHALIHHQRPDGSRLPYAECPMHNVVKTGEPHVSQDDVFVRKGGAVFPIAAISTPIREGNIAVASVTAFRDITEQKRVEQDRERLIVDLQQALAKVKQLSGLLPICASCKKIRDDKGYWRQIEAYVTEHSEAEFSHGLCPDCADKFYSKYKIRKG